MVYAALYAYVQPYQQLYVNILETVLLTDILLLITSSPIAQYKVIKCSIVVEYKSHYLYVIVGYFI